MINVLLILLAMQMPPSSENPVVLSSDGNAIGRKPNTYCGIYAAFGAATAVLQKSDHKPATDFDALLSTEYVSGFSGSSTKDILRAVERLGCNGHAFQFLSLRSLEDSKNPLILHVSGRGTLGSYKHWILFLGIESGKAVVRDGEGGDYLMPLSELLCRWDGKAIAVFAKNQKSPRLFSSEVTANCLFLGGIGFIVLIIKSLTPSKRCRVQLFSFVAIMGLAGLYSFLVNPLACVEFSMAHAVDAHTRPDSIRRMNFEDIEQSIELCLATIVDCRYREDFENGCIPESVSIPVDISQVKLEAVAKTIRRDLPVILYCQSRGCKFSDVIAVELAKLGFKELSIYRNGYAEWESKKQ